MTPKQQRFVEEYSLNSNATQAAIKAGYAESSAAVRGAELVKNRKVADALEQRRQQISDELGVTERMIVEGLLKEATYFGKGAVHSARVTAWSWLGKYRRMFEDDTSKRGDSGSAPVTVNVNILNNNA